MSAPEAQRIDKWLWHARFARTRSAAQRLVTDGHVRVNREKVDSASRAVRPGDVLTLAIGRGVRVIRICGIAERRGGFEVARQLYEEQAIAHPSEERQP
jgi:ribosome-associated heat shock protein Hsp15